MSDYKTRPQLGAPDVGDRGSFQAEVDAHA